MVGHIRSIVGIRYFLYKSDLNLASSNGIEISSCSGESISLTGVWVGLEYRSLSEDSIEIGST